MKEITLKFQGNEYTGKIRCDEVVITKTRGAYQRHIEFVIDGNVVFELFSCEAQLQHVLDNEYTLLIRRDWNE